MQPIQSRDARTTLRPSTRDGHVGRVIPPAPRPSRRRLLGFAATAIGAAPSVMLAACGPLSQGTPESAGTAAEAPAKLMYLHQWSQQQGHGPATDQMVAQFQEQFPTIQVEAVYTAKYYEKLAAVIAGGDWPDVVTYNLAFLPQLIRRNVAVPAETLAKGAARFDVKDMVPGARDMVTFDGKIQVMPYVLNSTGLIYNQTIFQQKGLDPNRPPTTWDELVELGRRLTGQLGDREVWGVQFPKGAADPISPMLSFLWQNKGEVVDMKRRAATWNSSAGAESLQYQVDLIHKHRIAPLTPPPNATQAGHMAMWYAPPGQVSRLQAQVGDAFQWATAELPRGKERATSVGGHSLAVLKTNRHHDQAWRFIHWYLQPEHLAEYLVATTTLPPWRSVEQHQVWQRYVGEEPRIRPYVAGLAYARPTPKLAAWEEIVDFLAQARDTAAKQERTPKEALDDAVRQAEPLI
ncbi:MAG: ABC transporter substrate-binding protein, partial [Chloroflexota bacterium]